MDIQKILTEPGVQPFLLKARYGIEKESQRVTLKGNLVKTDYPEKLGNRSYHPYIQTDFAETQMEIVTPVTNSITELFRWLAAIHDTTYRSMNPAEMLWPLSMPPALPKEEEDIPIAKLDRFEDVLYRRYLSKTYGRRKQMVSGIHFNFEFDDELLQKIFQLQTDFAEYSDFKTEVYLKVTRNYLHYRWLIAYFYGASPLSEKAYFTDDDRPAEPVRSIRSSRYGYKNKPDVQVTYRTISEYIEGIDKMVESGKLSEEKEFYAPVRLRGGKKVADLAFQPIRYIELRNIDLDPFQPYGISKEEVEFLHIFLLFLLVKAEGADLDEWVAQGDALNDGVSLEHPLKKMACQKEAYDLINELKDFVSQTRIPVSDGFFDRLDEMLADPGKTLAGRLYQASQENSQKQTAISLGTSYHKEAWAQPYRLNGFGKMELSTQILFFDAIQKGIQVEVLDEADQFLQLTFAGKKEYVKNGNMTSKDTYISPLIMGNKTVTKKLLQRAGLCVPEGKAFTDQTAAENYFPEIRGGIVIKPKSTNYGLGITIFKRRPDLQDYHLALRAAFKEDSAILIEEFLSGTEYRFFVVGDKVKAVLLRVPANVTGDGKHTIRQLVELKNQDPLRGSNHRSPLEKIQLGESELQVLKEQGYDFDSIPKKEVLVYLRENSNVSTGGDSIDRTAAFSADYKKIAVDAAQTLGAVICGVDMLVDDRNQPASATAAYGIIEANFNPMMHMHCYPYQGEGQRVTMDILRLLFPTI